MTIIIIIPKGAQKDIAGEIITYFIYGTEPTSSFR